MAITQTYVWPIQGATAPAANFAPPAIPTSSTPFDEVAVQLQGDAASTSVTITTNFGLTPAELARFFPEVTYEPEASGAPSHYVSARASNSVTLGFSATFGLGVTFGLVRVKRPQRTTL